MSNGPVYDDIDITVNLNKARFRNIGTNANEFGFNALGAGNSVAIPNFWDFTIVSAKDESNNNLTVTGKSFRYTNNLSLIHI